MHAIESAEEVRVQPLQKRHLRDAARLHRSVLPPSFFSRLGLRYVRAYLDTYRTSDHAVALVVLVRGRVAGFLVGTVAPVSHAHWVLRAHGPRLAALALLGLVARPPLLVFFLRTRVLRYARGIARRAQPGRSTAASGHGEAPAPAVLAHVAVSPDARRLGLGQALVERFASDARGAGSRAVELVTRADGGAGAFYAVLGYERIEQRVDSDGVAWDRYRLPLE